MDFHWSLSDNKSPQISETLLGILADLNNAVIWMVYTCPLISMCSSPSTKSLVSLLRTPIKIGITVIFMFHSFLSPLAKFKYLFFFLLSFNFTSLGRQSQQFCRFIIIIMIVIIHSLQLFTSALADGFSLESEWQPVSSSLQDSSQYSGRS